MPFPKHLRRATKQHEDSYCSLSLWDLCGSFDGCYFSLYFPISLKLGAAVLTKATTPQGVGEVFKDLLPRWWITLSMPWLKLTILVFWYGQLSLVLPCEQLAITRRICNTLAEVTSQIVRWIINLAPFGILGLVFNTISENGVGVLADYGVLILV